MYRNHTAPRAPRRHAAIRATILLLPAFTVVAVTAFKWDMPASAQGPTRPGGPLSSQPLAITLDGFFLGSVNPDNNSVSFFDLRLDRNRKIAEVPVQTEPNGIAILPNE